jgi:hypothetical protein
LGPTQLTVVLLRIYALTLLVDATGFAAGAWQSLSRDVIVVSGDPPSWWSIAAPDLVPLGFHLGAAALLLCCTRSVARFVCRGLGAQDTRPASLADLTVLGFALVGLYCAISGVQGLVASYAWWDLIWLENHRINFLAPSLQFALGVFLFLAPHALLRVARWARRPTPPTPPA